MKIAPDEVLEFWFGDALRSPEAVDARCALWFARSDAFDREIRERFAALPRWAALGAFEAWREAPESTVALLLVLDQFPRNLHRDDPRAFAFDAQAREVALAAVDVGFDRRLHPLEASFLYLPFEHAEDLDLQNLCVERFEALVPRAPDGLQRRFEEFASYARRHRDVIARFGRFPHRNDVLARESTPEERAFLASGGDDFSGGSGAAEGV